jgi:hypothetical protein
VYKFELSLCLHNLIEHAPFEYQPHSQANESQTNDAECEGDLFSIFAFTCAIVMTFRKLDSFICWRRLNFDYGSVESVLEGKR